MVMLLKNTIALAEGSTIDPSMIWTVILIAIILLFLVYGRRLLLMIKGKSADEDLDDID